MSEDIRKVVDYLDQNGFLVTDRFVALRRQVQEAFAAAETRPAYMAGKSYPATPKELRAFLDGCLAHEGPPKQDADTSLEGEQPLRCLIVPHIDYERGGRVYARGFRWMARYPKPDTALIFGVAHAGGSVPFILTRKHFETPLGSLKTDGAIVDRLAASCRWDPYESEILHRTEHSIEFQVVMLSYLYGPSLRIVPILCGQVLGAPDQPHPDTLDDVAAFLHACHEIARAPENRVTVIGAADFAHVGRRFGDPFDVDVTTVERIARTPYSWRAVATTAVPNLDPRGRVPELAEVVQAIDHVPHRRAGLGPDHLIDALRYFFVNRARPKMTTDRVRY
jgi:AmmeMemoRadiSam system protein B